MEVVVSSEKIENELNAISSATSMIEEVSERFIMVNCICICCLLALSITTLHAEDFDRDVSEESIAEQKAAYHKLVTGESSVGYQGVRRSATLMSAPSARPMLMAAAAPLVANVVGRQETSGEKKRMVKVSYDLNTSYQCTVACDILVDGVALPGPLTFTEDSNIGMVSGGKNRTIYWDAKKDWNNKKSERVKARVTVAETDVPTTWAHITIAWAEWGGRDVDICGYWLDKSSVKVGWSYSSGSTDSAWRSVWKGDNTGTGPEYVDVAVAEGEILGGVTSRKYRIHFNYFGAAASTPKVRVTVSSNGVTKSTTCSASTRSGLKAETSDPHVTITFDSSGTPTSISASAN